MVDSMAVLVSEDHNGRRSNNLSYRTEDSQCILAKVETVVAVLPRCTLVEGDKDSAKVWVAVVKIMMTIPFSAYIATRTSWAIPLSSGTEVRSTWGWPVIARWTVIPT